MLPSFKIVIGAVILCGLLFAMTGAGIIVTDTRTRVGEMPALGRPMTQQIITSEPAQAKFRTIGLARRSAELEDLRARAALEAAALPVVTTEAPAGAEAAPAVPVVTVIAVTPSPTSGPAAASPSEPTPLTPPSVAAPQLAPPQLGAPAPPTAAPADIPDEPVDARSSIEQAPLQAAGPAIASAASQVVAAASRPGDTRGVPKLRSDGALGIALPANATKKPAAPNPTADGPGTLVTRAEYEDVPPGEPRTAAEVPLPPIKRVVHAAPARHAPHRVVHHHAHAAALGDPNVGQSGQFGPYGPFNQAPQSGQTSPSGKYGQPAAYQNR
jgi:hypothetical protein